MNVEQLTIQEWFYQLELQSAHWRDRKYISLADTSRGVEQTKHTTTKYSLNTLNDSHFPVSHWKELTQSWLLVIFG